MLLLLRWALRPQLPSHWSAQRRQALWAASKQRYASLAAAPPVSGLGLRMLLRLQRWNAAVYLAGVEQGWPPDQVSRALGESSWRLAKPALWLLFGVNRLAARSRIAAVRATVNLLFRWVFSAPFERRTPARRSGMAADVSFDVLACPLADYFARLGLAELTPHVACGLDQRMAELWGVDFARKHTIAQGAPLCDFRFMRL